MENKDFRDRLREHEVPVKNDAWDMMNAMIESSQESDSKQKRKRRFFFWIWFFGFGFFITSVYLFYNLNSNNHFGHDYNKNSESVIFESHEKSPVSSIKPVDKKVLKTLETKIHIDEVKEKTNFDFGVRTKGKSPSNKLSQNINDVDDKSFDQIPRQAIDKSIKTQNLGFSDSQNLIIDKESVLQENNDSIIQFRENNITQNSNSVEVKSIEVESIEAKSTAHEIREKLIQDDEMAINLQLEKLSIINKLNFLKKENSVISINPQTEQKWFAFGQIGYASFNNNPGLTLGGGVLYAFDKLLYFESLLSYSNGKETGIPNGELATSEHEIDLGIIINLNLLNARKNRVAFELGTGFTKYWGNRIIRSTPITIDNRSSIGTHIQAGISYHYSFDNNTRLGLKLGAVSYDDAVAYLAFKFYKKI